MPGIAFMKLKEALNALRQEKPLEPGEEARRYAVTITELEKVIAYYFVYIEQERVFTKPPAGKQ